MDDEPAYDLSVSINCRLPMEDGGVPHSGSSRQPSSADASGTTIESTLRLILTSALSRHDVPTARLHVAIVDAGEIARLHQRFLGRSGPTDVLAFDLLHGAEGNGKERAATYRSIGNGPSGAGTRGEDGVSGPIEGDIVVSVDAAGQEAKRRGHGVAAELALYALHGLLHLLGYDDHREDAAAHMHEVEDQILASVGIGAVYGTQPRAENRGSETDRPEVKDARHGAKVSRRDDDTD
ncbi:MAG: rRNA maturation RNase YbeY [Planctomycetes bacterium]|nr:rRNA maturation RNase YbeY [Planctomycetota bacterium]